MCTLNKTNRKNQMRKNIPLYGALIVVVTILIGMVAGSGQAFLYDERLFMPTLSLFRQYGISWQFLLKLRVAPGPLYAIIHTVFAPLTSLQAPEIRFVSVFFLAVTGISLAAILEQLEHISCRKCGILLLGLPPIYVIFGMALSGSYSMAFCTIAVAFSIYAFEHDGIKGWSVSVLAGICWALTLLGRQSYLPATLALLILAVRDHKLWLKVSGVVLVGIVPITVLFFVWGGFTPPEVSYISKGFKLDHFIYALASAGIFSLILSPRWLLMGKKCIFFAAGGILLNIISPFAHFTPMETLVSNVLNGESAMRLYGRITGSIFVGIAVVTLFGVLLRAWERRGEKYYLYCTTATLGILLTTVKITCQFSSRYAIMAAPFIIVMAAPYIKFNRPLTFRVIGGALVGLLALSGYLFFSG